MTNQPANPSPAPEVLARLREVEFNAGIFSTYRQQEKVWRDALEAALTALAAQRVELEGYRGICAELVTTREATRRRHAGGRDAAGGADWVAPQALRLRGLLVCVP